MPLVTIDGLSIHYLHKTPPGTARGRVIYIHGTGCRGAVFERHLEVIAKTHEVIAPDLPGHGDSGGRGFRGVADHAAVCAALVRELGWSDCVVAGHSMGGGVALAFVLYDTDLVRGLILIDTGARLRVAPAILRYAREVAAGTRPAGGDQRLGFSDSTPDDIVAAVQASKGYCDPEVVARDWVADDSCDFLSRLKSIKPPALAICGREDTLTPLKYHEYFVAHMPDCRLEVIDDAAHWPFAEQPETFDQHVLAFLETIAAA